MDLRWFRERTHPKLAYLAGKFEALADDIIVTCYPTAERDAALQKLLDARDAALRAKRASYDFPDLDFKGVDP